MEAHHVSQPSTDRLPPVELAAGHREPPPLPHPQTAAAPGTRAPAPAPQPVALPSLSVRYAHDDVAGCWVAQIFDGDTGKLVRTVPDTSVEHQLARLREIAARGHVDARA